MTFIIEKIRVTCGKLQSLINLSSTAVENVSYISCGYKKSNTPPPSDAGWQVYDGKEIHAPVDSHFWFRFSLDVPASEDGIEYRLSAKTGREGQWDAMNPQCILYLTGETAYQAFDTNHTDTPVKPGHYDAYIYFYNGRTACAPVLNLSLDKVDLRIEKLYYDLFVPFESLQQLGDKSEGYVTTIGYLDRATLLLDFRKVYSEDFYRSVAACTAFMAKEYYGNPDVMGKSNRTVSFIGHTHIDVAWLWTLAQTDEKAQRSFSTVIRLMEKYPDYVFMSSQPQLYAYVKKNDPVLYEKIKERVKEGRWEAEGAMWLESDTNLISGESLIRQIIYGQRFMKEEFGVTNRSLWLPDVFGYSAALPQILKKSGIDRFFTTKIRWCETDTFPHDSFIWQGLDGSEIFAVLSDNYVKDITPKSVFDTVEHHISRRYNDTVISTFGYGDGGGGPTAGMLERFARMKDGLPGYPKLAQRKSGDTIGTIKEEFDENTKNYRFTPKWAGELYLEMHRGTYTSMAQNKKYNRKSEYLLGSVEAAEVTRELFDGKARFPRESVDGMWEAVLRNQFHDIIPGSSIKEVYEDSAAEYETVLKTGDTLLCDALSYMANRAPKDGIFVYNPAPYSRKAVITGKAHTFISEEIPAHGYAVIEEPKTAPVRRTFATEKTIENERLSVRFNDKYHIVSLYDREAGRELIPEGGEANVLEVYEDYPRCYDAWEITEYYKQKKWLADGVEKAEVIVSDVSAGIRITRAYGDSEIVQEITLTDGEKHLDFKTDIEWREDHVLLKAAFPFDILTREAACDIQFGHIERPTHRNTSWDEAKFEFSAHKYADISEEGYGVSLMNDCKYGYSAEENILRLSLLKAATYPNPVADRGHHSFTYSVLPHVGRLSETTVKESYFLNMPVIALPAVKGESPLPAGFSFVTSDNGGFAVETIKPAEDGNGVIVRGYEALGGKRNVTLTFGVTPASVTFVDLKEDTVSKAQTNGNTVSFVANPFEIVTLRVKF